jgi:hypothetical protein
MAGKKSNVSPVVAVSTQVEMQANYGQAGFTIACVKEWIAAAERAGAGDDTPLNTDSYLSVMIGDVNDC